DISTSPQRSHGGFGDACDDGGQFAVDFQARGSRMAAAAEGFGEAGDVDAALAAAADADGAAFGGLDGEQRHLHGADGERDVDDVFGVGAGGLGVGEVGGAQRHDGEPAAGEEQQRIEGA